MRNRALHYYSLFTLFSVLFLIFAGGMVTSTGSGLSVPDWPLSYGMWMPPMVGGIFYEHGHRMIATGVGLLTIILMIWVLKVEKRRWVKVLSVTAVVSVCLQGLLGGLTVLFLLPDPISVGHAALAQIFLSLIVVITVVTSSRWEEEEQLDSPNSLLPWFAASAVSLIFVQLLLGAWVRHAEVGLVIPDFPLSFGKWWPADLSSHLPKNAPFPVTLADFRGKVLLNFAHRLGAVGVSVAVILAGAQAVRYFRNVSSLYVPACAMMISLIVQILLGAFVVWTKKLPLLTTAHVVTGALVLTFALILLLHSLRLCRGQALHPECS